jgi:hypothetical protein
MFSRAFGQSTGWARRCGGLLFDLLIAAIINFIRAQSARMIAGRQPQETGVAVPRARRALI